MTEIVRIADQGPNMQHKSLVILGSGPTGLSAAQRFNQWKPQDWILFEKSEVPGGLAQSVTDAQGFTWDLGGHVVFSHYEEFDLFLNRILKDNWIYHQRESWIWMRDRFIPYPLQNNIWRLPESDRQKCLEGLRQRSLVASSHQAQNFDQWLRQSFGLGLYETFMAPYNLKVWAHPLSLLNTEWVADRVAPVELPQIEENIRLQQDHISWGPNSQFRYPRFGGNGAIWKALYETLPVQNFRFHAEVTSIDLNQKHLTINNEVKFSYDHLISTIPLNKLLNNIEHQNPISTLQNQLLFSSTHIIGIGLEGAAPEHLKTKCWVYFSDDHCPFYRLTVFSNYSSHNVPDSKCQWSLLVEVSESSHKPVNPDVIVDQCVEALIQNGFIENRSKIINRWSRRLEQGYPVPFVGRNKVLDTIQSYLLSKNVYSRGRFGGWKYEVSNQDHSYMQGIEAVDNILFQIPEETYFFPEKVNTGKKVPKRKINF